MKLPFLLSAGNFFAAAHFFLVIYVTAPYLATFIPASSVGLVVSVGAMLSLIGYLFMPRLVRRFGPRLLAAGFSTLAVILLLLLALVPSVYVAVLGIVTLSIVSLFIGYQLDLLLEEATLDEARTGTTRTVFITGANLVLIACPLAIGFLLGNGEEYGRVFLTAAVSLIPFILLMLLYRFPEKRDQHLHALSKVAHCLASDTDTRTVLIASFILSVFFYLAPLYIPLYLNTVLGFPWSELGWMFAVMLLPFVLLEYPAGWLADHKFGDKEIMAIGFAITGVFFALVGLIAPDTSLLVILIILVGTRVGAALVEAMIEGHFFRRIASTDTSSVAVFRMTRPFGMLAAPLLATALLVFADYRLFFLLSGLLILLAGVWTALKIRDIR